MCKSVKSDIWKEKKEDDYLSFEAGEEQSFF